MLDPLGIEMVFWHWWIIAGLLLVAEILAPGIFFLWLGAAAVLTGLIALLIPALDWRIEGLMFAALSVVVALLGRRFYDPTRTESDRPLLNRRGAQYVGRTFTLEQGIVHGAGRLKVEDTTWKVTGPDLPSGTMVRVVAVEGVTMRVEPL